MAGEARRSLKELLERSPIAHTNPAAIARDLLTEFGSFAAVVKGTTGRLRRLGVDDHTIEILRWCRSAIILSLRQEIEDRPVISTSTATLDYLRFQLAHETRERLSVLYLNTRLELLADATVSIGTVDAAPFYPREIVAKAFDVGATSLIMAHNHPSGGIHPSKEDVACTRALAAICRSLGMTLLDHVIVGASGTTSLRQCGLFEP